LSIFSFSFLVILGYYLTFLGFHFTFCYFSASFNNFLLYYLSLYNWFIFLFMLLTFSVSSWSLISVIYAYYLSFNLALKLFGEVQLSTVNRYISETSVYRLYVLLFLVYESNFYFDLTVFVLFINFAKAPECGLVWFNDSERTWN